MPASLRIILPTGKTPMPDNALRIATYLAAYKPIPSSVPGWDPHRQATWPATTATLVSAGGQAILDRCIDDDARRR